MDILSAMKTKHVKAQLNGTNESSTHSLAETITVTDVPESIEKLQVESNTLVPQWKIHGSHMVTRLPPASSFKRFYGDKLESEDKKIPVAAFDMDDTLICTKSGIKFGRGPYDWKWRNDQITPMLKKKMSERTFVLAIFTNQSSVSVTKLTAATSKSYKNLCLKAGLISEDLEKRIGPVPVLFFASTGRPKNGTFGRSSLETHFNHRKPELGMWAELERYIKICFGSEYSIDSQLSYFVGDAAGRDGDHLAADIGFAENAGVPFLVPEDYFGI